MSEDGSDMEDVVLEEVEESEYDEVGEGEGSVDEEEGEEEQGEMIDEMGGEDADDGGDADVSVNSFDELKLDSNLIQAIQDSWKAFLVTAESPEAAGEALYSTIYESAPSLQPLFTSPRAVQAMRFFQALAGFIPALADPARLKILVETLSFGHLQFDVTVPRVAIFRDAIVDLFIVELAEQFTPQARTAWVKLLNYVGGAFIYVRVHYAERITILLKSWKQVNLGDGKDQNAGEGGMDSAEAAVEAALKSKTEGKTNGKKPKAETKNAMQNGKGADGSKASNAETQAAMSKQNIPTTYPEMFLFNSAVMGYGKSTWMSEVLACFDNIVTNVANSARLQEECDILALRIARTAKGNVNLAEYKTCMLASLRNLLPKDWDTAHETAWNWLWENVERLVSSLHGKPAVWEKALGTLLASLDEDKKYNIRQQIYAAFFSAAPAGQDFFKQSNTYLHFIADKVMTMTLEIYQNPVKKADDISAVGLRHVGYGIQPELFGPFVTACVETLTAATEDDVALEAYRWSLGLISKMLVRTINEGATIVMRAINANSRKLLKKAVGCAPRGERFDWMLTVQVGTQSISPLGWSVESGNFEAARAIIADLLTIRADRERYYYGFDPLFKRHADIIKMLCDKAPDLVPLLLDGLLWRSRTVEGGLRRVNYYVKHLLVDEEGHFSKALKWISDKRDPKLVCHPVVIFLADVIWSKIAYVTFLYGKMWLFFTLVIFITSQSVLEYVNDGDRGLAQRSVVFVCRTFIYSLSMTELIIKHGRKSWSAYRTGQISQKYCLKYPSYLKQWQETASFLLLISLITMLCLEPIIHCWPHQDGSLFYERCKDHMSSMRFTYSAFSSAAMFLYYLLLLGLAVVSTRISAFVLVCVRMLSEVNLFLMALAGAIVTFSNSISVLEHESEDFAGIHKAAYSLIRMFLGVFPAERYSHLREEPHVLAVVVLFLIVTVIFLANMLIAQLICAYSSVYEDMVGYARLERATTIVEIMPSIPAKRWNKFVEACSFHKRLEFYIGDIGLAGGMQIWEPAGANPTNVDNVRRFAGSTSPTVQWPEDDADGDGQDRFERMEKLILKTSKAMQTMMQQKDKKGKGGSAGGMSSSMGMGGQEDADED